MKKQLFPRSWQTWPLLAFGLAVLTSMSTANVADADLVYEATTGNSTVVTNGAGTPGILTFTGATPDLIITNNNGNFNMAGFASTSDINTLLAAASKPALAATDTVTFATTVDSISAVVLRSNGFEFGMADTVAFRGGSTSNLILGMAAANSGSDVRLMASFQDDGTRNFNANQASLEDGFSITLTANSAGYSFFLSDILVAGSTVPEYTNGDTTATVSGTFAGTEFLDNFSTGYFYTAAQRFNGTVGDLVVDYSVATIDVTAIPEPTSLGIIALGLVGLVARRRR